MNEPLGGIRPQDHLVQFYGEETGLVENVAHYLREGAERGDSMIVVATPAHTKLFTAQLDRSGVRVGDLKRDGRLLLLDAERTLSTFLVDGEPDWNRFNEKVGNVIRSAKPRDGALRAYGEMVDLLWKEGRLGAATRLEGFWNRLLESERFGLYCAYTVDLLNPDAPTSALQEIISTHSHLLPVCTDRELETGVGRAMDDVLGSPAVAALLPLIRADVVAPAALPETERKVLWLRKNLPRQANDVLSRARAYYEVEYAQAGRCGT